MKHRHTHVGSPPHTWRIQLPWDYINDNYRITSTYVENTFGGSAPNGFFWDHLHIRGEYGQAPAVVALV